MLTFNNWRLLLKGCLATWEPFIWRAFSDISVKKQTNSEDDVRRRDGHQNSVPIWNLYQNIRYLPGWISAPFQSSSWQRYPTLLAFFAQGDVQCRKREHHVLHQECAISVWEYLHVNGETHQTLNFEASGSTWITVKSRGAQSFFLTVRYPVGSVGVPDPVDVETIDNEGDAGGISRV